MHHPSKATKRATTPTGRPPGWPAAPAGAYLPLLPPGPDGIRRSALHRAQRRFFPLMPYHECCSPGGGIRSCYSGLQVQGTANSPPSTAKNRWNRVSPRWCHAPGIASSETVGCGRRRRIDRCLLPRYGAPGSSCPVVRDQPVGGASRTETGRRWKTAANNSQVRGMATSP